MKSNIATATIPKSALPRKDHPKSFQCHQVLHLATESDIATSLPLITSDLLHLKGWKKVDVYRRPRGRRVQTTPRETCTNDPPPDWTTPQKWRLLPKLRLFNCRVTLQILERLSWKLSQRLTSWNMKLTAAGSSGRSWRRIIKLWEIDVIEFLGLAANIGNSDTGSSDSQTKMLLL